MSLSSDASLADTRPTYRQCMFHWTQCRHHGVERHWGKEIHLDAIGGTKQPRQSSMRFRIQCSQHSTVQNCVVIPSSILIHEQLADEVSSNTESDTKSVEQAPDLQTLGCLRALHQLQRHEGCCCRGNTPINL